MIPARRRKITSKKKETKKSKYFLFLLVVFVGLAFLVTKLFPPFDSGTLSIALSNSDYSGSIVVFDFNDHSMVTYHIPKETQISVSNQRGTWRMGSLWRLITSENLDKHVFSDSLMRTFKLPIDDWADQNAIKITDTNPVLALVSVFKFGSTSLNFEDRIKLYWYTRGILQKDREVVELSDTPFLDKTVLNDGEKGYLVNENAPAKVLGDFADATLVKDGLKVQVLNPNGSRDDTTKRVVEVVETLGVNVLAINKIDNNTPKGECEVQTNLSAESGIKKVADVLGCSLTKNNNTNFDANIILGDSFFKRF